MVNFARPIDLLDDQAYFSAPSGIRWVSNPRTVGDDK
jgi:hypothetical protein